MRRMIFILATFFMQKQTNAKETLNAIEAQLLRTPSILNAEDIILPGYGDDPKKISRLDYNFIFDAFLYGNADLENIYKDISSDNEQLIIDRIEESFGQPKLTIAKVGIRYQKRGFTQGFYINAGEIFIINNPVFPRLSGLLLADFSSITAYHWTNHNKRFSLTPSITFSRRKSIRRELFASDILLDPSSYKLNTVNWYNTIDASLETAYSSDHIKTKLLIRSLPISGQRYAYWDSIIQFETFNLVESQNFLSSWNLFIQYSPFYGGDYDVKNSQYLGTRFGFSDHFSLDLFMSANYDLNAIVKLRLENYEFTFFTKKESYDDDFTQQGRSIGFNNRYQF